MVSIRQGVRVEANALQVRYLIVSLIHSLTRCPAWIWQVEAHQVAH